MTGTGDIQRQRTWRTLALATLGLGVLAVAGLATLIALDMASASPQRHTIGHVGCKHGAHGLPWHAGHGKSFSYEPGLRPSRPGGP